MLNFNTLNLINNTALHIMSMQFLVLPKGVYLSMPENGNAILRSSVQTASDRHLNVFVFNLRQKNAC